LRPQNL